MITLSGKRVFFNLIGTFNTMRVLFRGGPGEGCFDFPYFPGESKGEGRFFEVDIVTVGLNFEWKVTYDSLLFITICFFIGDSLSFNLNVRKG